ncbi:ribosomal protein S18-alanine N-acetyltransferase [Chitinimonas sp.]|uniref:ribosomal protein S18-alanine N-acetyltransferase n=1 Tax=Chitinimonas sp. TaxID=1934313 RepID=UPI0035B3152F
MTSKFTAAVQLRPLTGADLPAVAAIEASLQDFPWTLLQFSDSLQQGHQGWVIEQADGIAAFALTSQVIDEVSLLTIGVHRNWQRQGLARALIDKIIEVAGEQGGAVLILEVRKGNAAARSLYRRLGFVETGQRRGYYRAHEGREDAILMALTLDEGGR